MSKRRRQEPKEWDIQPVKPTDREWALQLADTGHYEPVSDTLKRAVAYLAFLRGVDTPTEDVVE